MILIQRKTHLSVKVLLTPFSRPGKLGEVPCAAKSACTLRQPPTRGFEQMIQQASKGKESQQSLLCADIAGPKNGKEKEH
jgi:hypothetical protein